MNVVSTAIDSAPGYEAAENRFPAVILIEAKNLALRTFMEIRDSSRSLS